MSGWGRWPEDSFAHVSNRLLEEGHECPGWHHTTTDQRLIHLSQITRYQNLTQWYFVNTWNTICGFTERDTFRKPLGALFKNGSSLKELSKWNPQFSVRKHERYSCLFACYKTKGISVISVCRGHFMHGIQNKCLLCFKEKVKSKREVFIYFFISANFCSWSSFGTLSRNTLFWLIVPYLCCLLSCAKKGRWLEHKSHDGLGCEIICKKKLASSIEWLIRRYLCHNKHICADR